MEEDNDYIKELYKVIDKIDSKDKPESNRRGNSGAGRAQWQAKDSNRKEAKETSFEDD